MISRSINNPEILHTYIDTQGKEIERLKVIIAGLSRVVDVDKVYASAVYQLTDDIHFAVLLKHPDVYATAATHDEVVNRLSLVAHKVFALGSREALPEKPIFPDGLTAGD